MKHIILVILIVLAVLLFISTIGCNSWYTRQSDPKPIPIPENQIDYKSVEQPDTSGEVKYYIYNKDGRRFEVSRKMFDSLVNVPRK